MKAIVPHDVPTEMTQTVYEQHRLAHKKTDQIPVTVTEGTQQHALHTAAHSVKQDRERDWYHPLQTVSQHTYDYAVYRRVCLSLIAIKLKIYATKTVTDWWQDVHNGAPVR